MSKMEVKVAIADPRSVTRARLTTSLDRSGKAAPWAVPVVMEAKMRNRTDSAMPIRISPSP
jgi:hypothetical protein